MSELTERIAEVLRNEIMRQAPDLALTSIEIDCTVLAERIEAALMEQSPDQPEWGKGYRAGVLEGLCRAARHAQDHARAAQLGIPYEPGLPSPEVQQ